MGLRVQESFEGLGFRDLGVWGLGVVFMSMAL